MSTVILLSSSPPRVFARSPTPADSSSPLPSTAILLQGHSPGRKRFKQRTDQRDGFSPTFSTARQVLAEKTAATNVVLGNSAKNRFRSSQDNSVEEIKDGVLNTSLQTDPEGLTDTKIVKPTASDSRSRLARPSFDGSSITKVVIGAKDKKKTRKDPSEPLLLERATARKTDWSPPMAKSQLREDERSVAYSTGFLSGMLNNFNYKDDRTAVNLAQHAYEENPSKRRCVENKTDNAFVQVAKRASKPARTRSVLANKVTKRSRSPAKKSLTITGVATSNYFGPEEPKETPLTQFLTSTQAQLEHASTDSSLDARIRKTKTAAAKLKESKKNASQSLLLSPQSALRTYDVQEAIFGSASQLARDESPTFLRETIEAMKQSESFLMSDPFSSPQRTQPISIENTPKAGTAKYRKNRNLWSAAGRDDDNALLHVDFVDLTDTPAVRAAFAGKDVMLQPGAKNLASATTPVVSLRGGCSPLTLERRPSIVDISDLSTPSLGPSRAFNSTTRTSSPRKSPTRALSRPIDAAPPPELAAEQITEPPPLKPNYAGFTIHDLNKQIKSFGFKAMRKREKMIELLDRCWEEKYGPVARELDNEPQPVPFGDFLSNVHDVSARPEPKVKKPRTRKKKDEAEEGSKAKSTRKPRQKKTEKPDDATSQKCVKAPRKRKSKTPNNESILDVDGVWNTVPDELKALEAFDDWARPARKPKPKAQSQPMMVSSENIEHPPTPPATLPFADSIRVPQASEDVSVFEEIEPHATECAAISASEPSPVALPSQITAAIMKQSQSPDPERNHNTNPTWYEKILLYDPIILEDLASWLNVEGLGSIGDDREVSALDVREWCESQGICCLWRGGWRGEKGTR